MNVFVSSVVKGFETYRETAKQAIVTLGYQPLMAEDFPAQSATPERACLAGVRRADLALFVLGARYGKILESGLSATHEEYREAKDTKPVLVFVQFGITPEADQEAFMKEIEQWTTGDFRASFSDEESLGRAVTRAVHNHELAMSAGTIDEAEMVNRAKSLLPSNSAGYLSSAQIHLVITSGPTQQIIRPAEMKDALGKEIQQQAMFGENSVLLSNEATRLSAGTDQLVLEQSAAAIHLDRLGSIKIVQAAQEERGRITSLPAMIQEDILGRIIRGLRFGAWVLDVVDTTHRLTHVVIGIQLVGTGSTPWRTRAEYAANPNSGTMRMGGEPEAVFLTPAKRHRQALVHDADRIGEDFTALLGAKLQS